MCQRVHPCMRGELLRHGGRDVEVKDGKIRRQVEISERILDACRVVGDDRESRDFCRSPRCGWDSDEDRLLTKRRQREWLFDFIECQIRIFIEDHMALAASIGEPPPIATITSGWNSSISFAPFCTSSMDGSGVMPSSV